MINLILWLLFGALVGWLASIVMRDREGPLMNIVIGIVGAFVGAFLLSLLTRRAVAITNNILDLNSLLVAFIGAVVLLGIVNLIRRGSIR